MYWIKPPEKRTRRHLWFARHPVTARYYKDGSEKRMWLTYVLRCGKYYPIDRYGGGWIFNYKEKSPPITCY